MCFWFEGEGLMFVVMFVDGGLQVVYVNGYFFMIVIQLMCLDLGVNVVFVQLGLNIGQIL